MTRALISTNQLPQSILIIAHTVFYTLPLLLNLSHHTFSLQVVLCKFHSVFLSQKGQVFTCGHGQGGRLGHGDEQTYLVRVVYRASFWCDLLIPSVLTFFDKIMCGQTHPHKTNIHITIVICGEGSELEAEDNL